jgi:hypothetical protein
MNSAWSQTKTLIIASVAFITALAWNSAFQNLFDNISYLKGGGPWVYAVVITLIGVGITYLLQVKGDKDEDNPS